MNKRPRTIEEYRKALRKWPVETALIREFGDLREKQTWVAAFERYCNNPSPSEKPPAFVESKNFKLTEQERNLLFGSPTYKADDNGQLLLFDIEEEVEPPDPDDYPSNYEWHYQLWPEAHPGHAKALSKRAMQEEVEVLPIIDAIAQIERSQTRPQPEPQPQPKLPATVNVDAVLAKLEESSSTLDLFSDGNTSSMAKNTGKVLYEELVVDLGVGGFEGRGLRPIYCQMYRFSPTPYTPARKVLVVSAIPMVSKLDFGKYCDRDNFVNICRGQPPPK